MRLRPSFRLSRRAQVLSGDGPCEAPEYQVSPEFGTCRSSAAACVVRTAGFAVVASLLVAVALALVGCGAGPSQAATYAAPSVAVSEAAAPAEFWTVVVASYGNTAKGRASASRLQSRLAGEGLPAETAPSSSWSSLRSGYRVVFVGRYSSKASAAAKVSRLKARGLKGSYVRHFKGAVPAPVTTTAPPSSYSAPPSERAAVPAEPTDPNYYSSPPPGANPSPQSTGQNTQWHEVQGYTRADGTVVAPYYRRTK